MKKYIGVNHLTGEEVVFSVSDISIIEMVMITQEKDLYPFTVILGKKNPRKWCVDRVSGASMLYEFIGKELDERGFFGLFLVNYDVLYNESVIEIEELKICSRDIEELKLCDKEDNLPVLVDGSDIAENFYKDVLCCGKHQSHYLIRRIPVR